MGILPEIYVSHLAEICGQSVFQWREAVMYYENRCLKHELEEGEDLFRGVDQAGVDAAADALRDIYKKSFGEHAGDAGNEKTRCSFYP